MHAQFVSKADCSETKFENGASDRNSRTGVRFKAQVRLGFISVGLGLGLI